LISYFTDTDKATIMDKPFPDIETLIPHRGPMKLIEKIISFQEDGAVTGTTASRHWPLFNGNSISPLVFIELVAQTAGINNGMEFKKVHGENARASGWLVGIKEATFLLDEILPGDRFIIQANNHFIFESYREIKGIITKGSDIVSKILLQVVQADDNGDWK